VLPYVICLVPGFQPNKQAALTFEQKIELIESLHFFPIHCTVSYYVKSWVLFEGESTE
jgi:hypothetical protein